MEDFLLCIVIAVFVMGISSSAILAYYKIGPSLDNSNYTSLLSTNATFIATILAVAFSISIFIIQHAASNYVPSLLKMYLKDKNTRASFSLLSIIATLNVFGSVMTPTKLMTNIAIFSPAYSFGLLAFHFYYVTNTVSPSTIIQRIESKGRRYIQTLPQKIEKTVSKDIRSDPRIEDLAKRTGSSFIKQVTFHREDIHEPTKLVVRQVLDLVQKAIGKREIETAEIGLKSVCNIVAEYVEVRSDDSTPDDKFISFILEQLKSLSTTAFDNRDTFTLRVLSNAYREIGISTTRIPLIGGAQTSHESTNLVVYHLEISLNAIEKDLYDGSAEAIRSIRDVGANALKQHSGDALAIHSLTEIGIKTSSGKDWYVPREICGGLSMLISTAIEAGTNSTRIGLDLESVSKLSVKIITTLPVNAELILLPFFGPKSKTFFKHSASMMVARALQQKNGEFPIIEIRAREKYVQDVIEDIVRMMSASGLAAAKIKDTMLCSDIAQSLFEIASICVREEFVTFSEGLIDRVDEAIASILSLYQAFVGSHAIITHETLDNLVFLAFEAMRSERETVAIDVIKDMTDISLRIYKEHKHEAKELVTRVVMVGVYAVDNNHDSIAKSSRIQIHRYESIIAEEEDLQKSILDEVKSSVEQHGNVMELHQSPEQFLRKNLSSESWDKYRKLEP